MAKRKLSKKPELTFGSVCLVKTVDGLENAHLALLKQLVVEEGLHGIYLAFGKPGYAVFGPKSGLEAIAKNLFVIDARSGARIPAAEGQLSLQGPTALTELSVYITKLTHDMSYRFVVIDSVNEVLKANGEEATGKFIEYVSGKVRRLEMNCIMFFVADSKAKRMMKTLESVSDQKIEME